MHRMRSIFIILMVIIGIDNLHASEHPARGLLIFLDTTETDGIGAISDELLGALSQKAGPILASTSLIKNIFSEYGKDMNDPSYENRFQSITNAPLPTKNTELAMLFEQLEKSGSLDQSQYKIENVLYKYILLQALNFNADQWIIKKIGPDVCLFIPITYLESHKINSQEARSDNSNTQEPSHVELQLGLRVNHMPTVAIEEIVQTPFGSEDQHYFIKALYNEALQISPLFCTRYEYNNTSIPIPEWTIFMSGHGRKGKKIAGLSNENFKKLLDFLDHKILCKLLIYSSCYSAGVNIETVYKETGQNLQKTYSFPIIMYALTDAPVFAITPPVVEMDAQNNLILSSGKNHSFEEFLQAAENMDEPPDYQDIMEYIFSFEFNIDPNEAPQIKLPGLEWFSVIDTDNIVNIGHILAQSRDPQLPLHIATFFKKDPYLILLYTPHIPFALHLNNNVQAIVSMIPGDATHVFTKLSSDHISANKIIETFMKIDTLKSHKLFFIKEITGIDTTVHDVLIAYQKIPKTEHFEALYTCTAYYIQDKTLYIKESQTAAPQKASAEQIAIYQTYIEQITASMQQAPAENSPVPLLPITIGPSDIEKIKSALRTHLLYINRNWKRKRKRSSGD